MNDNGQNDRRGCNHWPGQMRCGVCGMDLATVLASYARKCEAAKTLGLPLSAVRDGESVPEGWELDSDTAYFMPPNIILLY